MSPRTLRLMPLDRITSGRIGITKPKVAVSMHRSEKRENKKWSNFIVKEKSIKYHYKSSESGRT